MNDEILSRLDKLAEGLGTTAKYLWDVEVHYQFAEGIVGLFMSAAFILVGIIAIKKTFKPILQPGHDNPVVALLFTLSFVATMAAFIWFYHSGLQVFCPEGAAIHEILKAVSGK